MNYKTINYEINWEDYTSHRCVMLTDIDEVIGEFSIQIIPNSQPTLVGFYIMPKFRGKRLSYRLLTKSFKLSSDLGLSELWLKVRKDNFAAIKLYSNAGFYFESDDGENNQLMSKFI